MTSIKILIAEDEILIARKLESTLQKLGYIVTAIAVDGPSAIQSVAETRPDLVLMDILMPGEIDGIDAAHHIKTSFQTPIVYLTAYSDSKTLQRAQLSEPFGYLIKPFQAQELHTTIQIALTKQQQEAQRLNTLRQNLSLSLPHEVNTPLSGILGCLNFLIDEYHALTPPEVIEMLELIRGSATRLQRVHQNFLLYTKLEMLAGNPTAIQELLLAQTFSAKELIETYVHHAARKANREQDIQLNIQEAVVQISEIYLQKIIEELLDNALKFSQPASPISIQGLRIEDEFVLSIGDRGIGLPPEQVQAIAAFRQFERHEHEQQGLGLGLALAKRLTELHNGQFSIASVADQGTTVTLKLKLVQTP